MPTVTYLGDDSNQASATWCNPQTKESITFPINQAVNVDPEASENKNRQALCRHIVKKLSSIQSPHFRLDEAKIDGRTREARALREQS